MFVLSVPLQTVQRYRCRRPALVANEPEPTMLRPGFPRLSHPEAAHAIPSVGFMAQVYRRVRLLVSPTIVGVQLTDQQRTAQAPPARRVTRVLDELIALHGRPTALRMDNGPELTAQALVEWADERRIDLHYIQPGKPDQNAFIERFNRSYRTEVLNAHLFESLAEVRALTEGWLVVYNQERPHDSLGRVPPLTFLPRLNPPVQSPFAVST